MEFIDDSLRHYAEQHTEPEPELLQRLNRETHLKTTQPRMLSGHLQGRFLSQLSRALQPKRIAEVGTFTGYSALCLAEGLPPEGLLHTFEVNAEFADFAQGYFDQSPYRDQIVLHRGSAVELLPPLGETLDLAFLDGKKEEYHDYYEAVLACLRPGGVLLTDNVLWSGKVVEKSHTDPATEALRAFNTFVNQDVRVRVVLLPLRDGVSFVVKR